MWTEDVTDAADGQGDEKKGGSRIGVIAKARH
jgi:hypothetical protein